jgi:hypothetical protein
VHQLRYLSNEEALLTESLKAYNRVVTKWPGSWFAQGYTLRLMGYEASVWVRDRGLEKTRRVAQLSAWQTKRLWAKLRKKAMPEKPEPKPAIAPPAAPKPLYVAIKVPVFVNDAPWPEEFSPEVQYRKDVPSRISVEIGQEKPYLERDEAFPGFQKQVRQERAVGESGNRPWVGAKP